jgi:hypothetical protein
MKFQANGKMRSHPGFTLANKVDPFSASGQLHAGFSAEMGEVTLGITEVPIKLRIPFLKRHHAVLIIGTIGPVSVKLDPCTCSVKDLSISGDVRVGGKEGLVVLSEGKVACNTEMTVEGAITGNLSLGKLHLGGESELEPTHPEEAAE